MNGKEFYKSKGKRCPSNLKELYDAHYFGNATYDETKRVYSIHHSTPLPYSIDKRVSRVDKLSLKLLDAAMHYCSVFPSMFPRIPEQTIVHYIDLFVEHGYIRRVDTESGVQYLELSPQGTTFYEGLKRQPSETRLKTINTLLNTFAEPVGRFFGEAVGTAIAASNKAS